MKQRDLDAVFSSEKDNWATPAWLFGMLHDEFNFEVDAAASEENTKCHDFFDEDNDGLACSWHMFAHSFWVNPPYGRGITGLWVKKAFEESQKGCTVVMLLPARTDLPWFHEYCMKAEIRFIRGRVRFEGAAAGAPFPSMIVIFRPPARSRARRLIDRLYSPRVSTLLKPTSREQ